MTTALADFRPRQRPPTSVRTLTSPPPSRLVGYIQAAERS